MLGKKKEKSLSRKYSVAVAIIFLVGGTAPLWWYKLVWGGNPVVSSSQTTSKSTSKQIKEDEDLNLQFELQSCQRNSNIVTCDFLLTKQVDVTGLYQGRGYYIYANEPRWSRVSRVITPDGKEHLAQKVQVGDKREKNYTIIKPIKGVPMQVSISFDIPMKFQKLSAFAIQYKFQADIASMREIVFKDIDISQ